MRRSLESPDAPAPSGSNPGRECGKPAARGRAGRGWQAAHAGHRSVHAGPHAPAHRRRRTRRARGRPRRAAPGRRPRPDHPAQRPRRVRLPPGRGRRAVRPRRARSASPCAGSPPTAASRSPRTVLERGRCRRARVSAPTGEVVRYDALLLALGARPEEAVPGALTFRGPQDSATRCARRSKRLHAGTPLRVAFVAGPDTAWTLPLYELALLTARWAEEHGLALEPWLVTYEHKPLSIFGEQAAASVAELLRRRRRPPLDRRLRRMRRGRPAVDQHRGRPAGRPRRRPPAPRRPARSPGSRATRTASSRSTTTDASAESPTSTPPAT